MKAEADPAGPPSDTAVRVAIVPHTHWDREWYAPFQAYRLRLVRLLDGLLPALEEDGSFAHFCLDGQTAVLDDYLAIRPGAEARLRRLAAAGRVSVGPWAILMDEFMVSGETIIRNLQTGKARARQLGATMPVGYLPDMFGHIAQMPQILALANLEHAVVWRGVPGHILTSAFWWEAPDGSRVRAEYLFGSYSNGRDLPDRGQALVDRARAYDAELGDGRLGGLLLMNGTDHQLPQPWVGRASDEANALAAGYRFEVTSLADYLAGEPVDGLGTWAGELRSGARSNLLMGVTSNRVDIKVLSAAAERAVERRAEPLLALFREGAGWAPSAALLDVAWSNLVLNSAHDSSCACSHDEVVDQVVGRYREARQVGDALAAEVVQQLGREVAAPPGSVLVVNSAAATRGGLVEVRVPGAGPVHFLAPDGRSRAAQVLESVEREVFSATVGAADASLVLDAMRGEEFAGRLIERADFGPGRVVLRTAWPGERGVDLGAVRERLAAMVAEGPVTVSSVEGPYQRVLIETGAVPGHGWTTLRPEPGGTAPEWPATAGPGFLDNGLASVEVDREAGTFTLQSTAGRVTGLGRLVDGGDGGDTYNWSPPAADTVVDKPASVHVDLLEAGPLRARLAITAVYHWPVAAIGDERSCGSRTPETAPSTVRTTLELRAGDPLLRVEMEIDNRSRDHRLRAHFPLPAPVTGSAAECAFAVVRRGLEAEGGPSEAALATFPARRFVDCSDGRAGLAVLSDGLLEYEVTEGGTEVAVTVLRSVGYLARLEPALRPNPAGPPVPVEGAQLQGRVVRRFGLLLHGGGWEAAGLHAHADNLLLPLEAVTVTRTDGSRSPSGQALAVVGAEVSAVLRDGDRLLVRLYNPSPAPAVADIARGGRPLSGELVDLDGEVRGRWDGRVVLRPWEIATVRTGPDGPGPGSGRPPA